MDVISFQTKHTTLSEHTLHMYLSRSFLSLSLLSHFMKSIARFSLETESEPYRHIIISLNSILGLKAASYTGMTCICHEVNNIFNVIRKHNNI